MFEVVRIEKGMKLMGMTTRNEYKVVNGEFQKRKCRLCAMGNQQVEGSQFDARDLYAPVLKPAEFRLIMAIAASAGAEVFKYDTSQAFLYGDVEQELYSRAPDWWPEPIPEGYSSRRTSTGRGRRLVRGTSSSRHGWRSMNTCRSTTRRLSS